MFSFLLLFYFCYQTKNLFYQYFSFVSVCIRGCVKIYIFLWLTQTIKMWKYRFFHSTKRKKRKQEKKMLCIFSHPTYTRQGTKFHVKQRYRLRLSMRESIKVAWGYVVERERTIFNEEAEGESYNGINFFYSHLHISYMGIFSQISSHTTCFLFTITQCFPN